MSVATEDRHAGEARDLPRPIMKKTRWLAVVLWLVPLAAAIGAGWYLYAYFQQRGPMITVTFSDATGILPGDTKVMYRGVEVGAVEHITLSSDHRHAMISARLYRPVADLARSGTVFWIVRPQVSLSGISGLSTLLSGPHIALSPGQGDGGESATQFTGLDEPPKLPEPGLTIRVRAVRIMQLQEKAPVYYRGFQIGTVRSMELGDDADAVWLTILIQPRYAVLVRTTSIFWLAKGLDVKGGIFSGVQMKVDSLQTLIEGGLTFSTSPKNIGDPAKNGAQFALYEEPKDEWTNWAPKIPLPPDTPTFPQGSEKKLPTGADAISAQQK